MPNFFRWMSPTDAAVAKNGTLQYTNGGRTSRKAFWVFDLEQSTYQPGAGLVRDRVLVKINFSEAAKRTIVNPGSQVCDEPGTMNGVLNDNWLGEAGHPNHIIVKNNEVGAYGIGRDKLKTLAFTNAAVATKKETAKALGKKEIEIVEFYRKMERHIA